VKPDAAELRSVPLFSSLTLEQAIQVAEWSELRTVDPGRDITPEGASGYSFFVILEGTAEVRHEGSAVGELGPGDHFGEIALLGGGRRTASIVATSPMRLASMFGTEFRRLERELPAVAASWNER
jgi:CRP-like cAMP-binding protein